MHTMNYAMDKDVHMAGLCVCWYLTQCLSILDTVSVHTWQCLSILDSVCPYLTVSVHTWQCLSILDSVCRYLTVSVHTWQCLSILDSVSRYSVFAKSKFIIQTNTSMNAYVNWVNYHTKIWLYSICESKSTQLHFLAESVFFQCNFKMLRIRGHTYHATSRSYVHASKLEII